MASIIRSPVISEKTHKLSRRSTRPKDQSGDADRPGKRQSEGNELSQPRAHNALTEDMKALVEQARVSVLNQFKEDAEAARELGRQRGMREGHLAGVAEGRKTFAEEVERIRLIADALGKTVATGNIGMEDMAIAIAFEATCKMLGNFAATSTGIEAFVRQAAIHLRGSETVVVRLNEADLGLLKASGGVTNSLASSATVTWLADTNVDLGGCVIETNAGELDARLETQIDRLRTTLIAARQNGTSSTQ